MKCLSEEALGEVLQLPESDPRRAHVAACPRCRALALSYRSFLGAADEASSTYGKPEDSALTAFRERMLEPAPEPHAAAPEPRRGWTQLFSPASRPAWALAAVALAAGAVVLWPRPLSHEPAPVERGTSQQALALSPPEFLAGGDVTLAWRAEPTATRYELRFYSTALIELGHLDAGAAPHATLHPTDLPAEYAHGAVLLYRVAALRGRDELAVSATQSIRKP